MFPAEYVSKYSYSYIPRRRDFGDDKYSNPLDFQGERVPGDPGTQGPGYLGPNLLGAYEVLLVPVAGTGKPGNNRECPGNWQKSNTSTRL